MTEEENETEHEKSYDSRDKALFGGGVVGALLIGLILGVALGGSALVGTTTETPPSDGAGLSISDANVTHISNSGTPEESASVSFGDNSVSVEGSIVDGACDLAELGSAEYDAEEDKAVINVMTVGDPDVQMCTMQLVGVEYEATMEFSGGMPGTVEVRHNGETAKVVER